MKHNVIAIVPAAGIGRRYGEGTNKPFETLGSRPLLIWAVETLQNIFEITEIIPVVKEADIEPCRRLFEECAITKIKRIVPGGRERQDSVFRGLSIIEDRQSVVLIHDGVRPLIDRTIILEALRQLEGYDGVVVGVPLKDTVKEVHEGLVRRTPPRDLLWAVQTPQIFYYRSLHDAYEKAMADSFYATDDSALVEQNGGRIKMVEGSYRNIKITTPEDICIAEALLGMERGCR